MTTNIDIKGNVHFVVRDKDGNIKQEFENHNIVVTNGDSLVADALLASPSRVTKKITRVGGTIQAYMIIGSGWTGISPKTNTWVNTALSSGSVACADPSPVRLSGANWTGTNSNILQYTTTGTGFTGVTGTANEIVLASDATFSAPSGTGDTGTSTLAYAQITPSVTLTPSDTLSVTWSITFSGS